MKPFQYIKDSIYNLVKDTVAGDTLLFYYSGHGTQIENDPKTEEPLDGKVDLDEVLVPLDYKTNGFITDVENIV